MDRKNIFILGWILLGTYGVIILALKLSPEYRDCITENFCLKSHQNTDLLALFYLLGMVFSLLAAFAAIAGTLFAFRKGYGFILGGVVSIIVGIAGIFGVVTLVPSKELGDFVHIIVISAMVILLGFLFFYAQWKEISKTRGK